MDSLLQRAQKGDIIAENEFFSRLRERFVCLVKYTLGEEKNCEDIAQEACLTVIQKYKREKFRENFYAWAYKILRNKIGNYLQKKKTLQNHQVEFPNRMVDSYRTVRDDPNRLLHQLQFCMRKLIGSYQRYARALNLIYQGFKVPEICRRMQINSNNLYVILNRGRSLLRQCLKAGSL